VVVDASRIARLRDSGHSWSEITALLSVSKGTAQRAVFSLPQKAHARRPATGGYVADFVEAD